MIYTAKDLKKVIENAGDNKQLVKLIRAVTNSINLESIDDVNNHGIDGGFSGFIYYSDTIPFSYKHRKAIIGLLEECAYSFGEDLVSMVCSFGIFGTHKADADDKKDIYRYLAGTRCKETTIPNVMSWFAAEEVCRMFEGIND